MDARSEVILRQDSLFQGKILLVNVEADGLSQQLQAQGNCELHHWNWHAGQAAALTQQGFAVDYTVALNAVDVDQVIVFIPKSKNLWAYVLHHLVSLLAVGSSIFIVGEKKGGIEGAAKLLHDYGKSFKVDSARHCQLWQLHISQGISAKPLQQWCHEFDIQFAEHTVRICALPGVFSQKHLDAGTALLLPHLHTLQGSQIADFGCGAGVIAVCIALSKPNAHVYALDVDAFALASTAMTFAANQIDASRYSIQSVTGINDAPLALNAIVSNPPFHQGIQTHYRASEDLCNQSVKHLKRYGQLLIVANRFLQYEPLLQANFHHCNTLQAQNGFKVLQAVN